MGFLLRPSFQQANRPTGQQANRPTGQQANGPTEKYSGLKLEAFLASASISRPVGFLQGNSLSFLTPRSLPSGLNSGARQEGKTRGEDKK